ncbi:hypothetical protein [Atopobium sp. oral taxon 416]|nr:hypothetical protein [Atopobium sp. oral taxon 416]QUC02627.1 hypothetical protein J4859_11395 [Atopobium sp. oral taxon 416]
MPKGKPRPAEFKARVTIEVMHAKKTVNELTFEHDLKPQPGQELGLKGYL